MSNPTDAIVNEDLEAYISREICPLDDVVYLNVVGGPLLLRLKDGRDVIITFHPNRRVKPKFEHHWQTWS